jgi:D-glycero-D-manno-heptose 1,7-bisphosphate phosphatase
MIEQACRDMNLDPVRSFVVGDRALDVACGAAAGVRTVRVRTGHGTRESEDAGFDAEPDVILNNLMEAAGWILRHSPR